MFNNPVYLTTLEMMQTTGFQNIMFVLWSPVIICILILLIIKIIKRLNG